MVGHGRPRVLLVDENPAVRGILSRLLNAAGFATQQAEDGKDGLAKLRGALPDVIISDAHVPPPMAGVEFVSVVRRRLPTVPVIVVSGKPQPDPLPQCFKPDLWQGKGSELVNEIVESIGELIHANPIEALVPEVGDTPFRARQDPVGRFVIPCSDCLRPLEVPESPEIIKTGEQIIPCTHCQALVRFFVDDSEPS